MKTLVFDLDGTLLDTLTDLEFSVNEVLNKHGYPQRSTSEIKRFLGNGIEQLVRLAAPVNLSEESFEKLFQDFKTYYFEHCMDNTKPYDGILQTLKILHKEGYQMAIVSNKAHSAVIDLYEQFFKPYIQIAIGESESIKRKPAPDAVFKALADLKADVKKAIYIGDSEVDIQTAVNANLPYICVTWGFREEAELIERGATIFAHKPEELPTLIQRVFENL